MSFFLFPATLKKRDFASAIRVNLLFYCTLISSSDCHRRSLSASTSDACRCANSTCSYARLNAWTASRESIPWRSSLFRRFSISNADTDLTAWRHLSRRSSSSTDDIFGKYRRREISNSTQRSLSLFGLNALLAVISPFKRSSIRYSVFLKLVLSNGISKSIAIANNFARRSISGGVPFSRQSEKRLMAWRQSK